LVDTKGKGRVRRGIQVTTYRRRSGVAYPCTEDDLKRPYSPFDTSISSSDFWATDATKNSLSENTVKCVKKSQQKDFVCIIFGIC
jgi:hypothetical protein